MNRTELVKEIYSKKSFLCVGLDTDIDKIPQHLLSYPDPVYEFNKHIIDATKAHCVSYKINTAFYESRGIEGWQSMQKTLAYIPNSHLTIADAKRGDIGNTSLHYAKAFFESLTFDAITVAPYMGSDSMQPFFSYPNKWAIVLALTSNAGSNDFEQQKIEGKKLYEKVIEKTCELGTPDNLMFVVGATKAEEFKEIRKIIPHHFLLVPGVGAQGGSLADVATNGLNNDCGLLVNASRSILFASNTHSFADAAQAEAMRIQQEMATYL
jgi:orotidine-5'-phosphate decarboxylase